MDDEGGSLTEAYSFLQNLQSDTVQPFLPRPPYEFPAAATVLSERRLPKLPVSELNINLQSCSPLLTCLPSEIQTQIFAFCFLGDPDFSQRYSHTAPELHPPNRRECERQSHPFRLKIDTNLLLSCKKVYFSARTLPISLNVHVFWPRQGKVTLNGPPVRYHQIPTTYFLGMESWQRDAVRAVKFIVLEVLTLPDRTGRLQPNLINQAVERVYQKKQFVSLMVAHLKGCMRKWKRLIVDMHSPALWTRRGWRFEFGRGTGREGNFGGVRDGIVWLLEVMRLEDDGAGEIGLTEVFIVVDWWRGTDGGYGSGVWEWIRTWKFIGMKLIDDGSGGEIVERAKENKYELRTLKWIATKDP